MGLRFTNRRYVPGGSYDSAAPWLARVAFSPDEEAQLLALVRFFDPKMTRDELLAGDTRFFQRRASSFAECPLEWWEIGDEQPAFRLWLCFADAGYLFATDHTERLATVIQWDFDIDEELAAPLRAEVAAAARAAIGLAPRSLLAEVSFG